VVTHTDGVLTSPPHHDVVVVRWPEQRADAERLARLDQPHLLLVEPGVPPPQLESCLADWIRLPADDVDVRARLSALAARSTQHPKVPLLDEFGEFAYGGQRVFLSPTDHRLAELLVSSFDRGVPDQLLLDRIREGEEDPSKIRVYVSRLRRRIRPLGLEITSIRGFGYRLHSSSGRAQDHRHAAE
jgi:two-component system, OmpR family, response regulator